MDTSTEIVAIAGAALLALLTAFVVKRKADKAPPQTREDRAVVTLVRALGYDPATVLVRLVRGNSLHQGIQILDKTGKPLQFYSLAKLRRLQKDPKMRAAFGSAMRAG